MKTSDARRVVDRKRLFQFRVVLRCVGTPGGSVTPIWRSVVVAPETTFDRLHEVIQAAMGWENFHLHRFGRTMRMDGRVVVDSYWEGYEDDEGRSHPLGSTPVGAVDFRVGDSFIYVYDLGDEWVHDVRVEKKPERKGGRRHPWVVDGKGACPPEDSGGPDLFGPREAGAGQGAGKGDTKGVRDRPGAGAGDTRARLRPPRVRPRGG